MSLAYDRLKKIKRADRIAQKIAEGKMTVEEYADSQRIKRLIKAGKLPEYVFQKDAHGRFPLRGPPSYAHPKGRIVWEPISLHLLLTTK
jgi:hypothetical protein